MIFENLSEITGFSPKTIKRHLLTLNALQDTGSCSKEEKSALWPNGESHFTTCPQASRWSNNTKEKKQ